MRCSFIYNIINYLCLLLVIGFCGCNINKKELKYTADYQKPNDSLVITLNGDSAAYSQFSLNSQLNTLTIFNEFNFCFETYNLSNSIKMSSICYSDLGLKRYAEHHELKSFQQLGADSLVLQTYNSIYLYKGNLLIDSVNLSYFEAKGYYATSRDNFPVVYNSNTQTAFFQLSYYGEDITNPAYYKHSLEGSYNFKSKQFSILSPSYPPVYQDGFYGYYYR